jgi:hypothetical protein
MMITSTITFFAHGHKNIVATHKTTFEITKEAEISKQGDCIVAVESTKGSIDLPLEFRKAVKKEGAKITIIVEVEELKEIVKAEGNPQLHLTHLTDLVVRKSNFVCSRTLAICANKAAIDFSRDFVEKLKKSNQPVKVILTVESQ